MKIELKEGRVFLLNAGRFDAPLTEAQEDRLKGLYKLPRYKAHIDAHFTVTKPKAKPTKKDKPSE